MAARMSVAGVSKFIFSFWPGSLRLWRDGDLHALCIALMFGMMLCLAWTGTFIYPMWLSGWKISGLFLLIVVASVFSLFHSITSGLMLGRSSVVYCSNEKLAEAQALYLQANYFEVEQILSPYVNTKYPDVEASLMVASVLRRTGRYDQSLEMLERIEQLEMAGRWLDEIRREKKAAKKLKIQPQTDVEA